MTKPNIPRNATGSTNLEHALAYLARGWCVIPVTRDKKPLLSAWAEYQRRVPTEREVRAWWARWPGANIAVLTGAVSGLIVLDADGEAGLGSVRELGLPPTLTAVTGGGGRHYYFKHPGGGGTMPNAVRFMPGLDARGDGGYVVVPPSIHLTGTPYAWENPDTRVAALPSAVLGLLRKQRPGLQPEDWGAVLREGERDSELTRRAGRLLRLGLSAEECLYILQAVNQARCRPPLPRPQVAKIARSIAAREAARAGTRNGEPAAGARGQFTILSQQEMLRRYGEDETEWVISEWLPAASCGLLVAPPGNYKTWILTALAFSVSTGRPFLDRWPVLAPGPVLVVQQEDPWSMLQGRLARMFEQEPPGVAPGADPRFTLDCRFVDALDCMPVYWYTDRELHFSDRAVMDALEQRIAELRPRAVLIDPLYTAADTKDYMAGGAQQMLVLKSLRDAYGCSFVVAHHTTVAGAGSEDRSAIWGSQFLNAWLEFGWRIPQGDGDTVTVIRHYKGAGETARIRLRFMIDDYRFAAEILPANDLAGRAAELVRSGRAASARTLARELGIGKTKAARLLRALLGENPGAAGAANGREENEQ